MTIVGVSKITSKGQITLPKNVRNLLNVGRGQTIAFGLAKEGVVLSRCTLSVDPTPFSKAEWQKIEKAADAKGKVYGSAEEAKKHIKSL